VIPAHQLKMRPVLDNARLAARALLLLLEIVSQIVPVAVRLVQLESLAQVVDVTAVLSLAAEPVMTGALKTVNALLVLSAIFLFYLKELLIF
jgi:hypothetical protein